MSEQEKKLNHLVSLYRDCAVSYYARAEKANDIGDWQYLRGCALNFLLKSDGIIEAAKVFGIEIATPDHKAILDDAKKRAAAA